MKLVKNLSLAAVLLTAFLFFILHSSFATVPQAATVLKSYFQSNSIPTQAQYAELIDTMFWYVNQTYTNSVWAWGAAHDATNTLATLTTGAGSFDLVAAQSPTDGNGQIYYLTNIAYWGKVTNIVLAGAFVSHGEKDGVNRTFTVTNTLSTTNAISIYIPTTLTFGTNNLGKVTLTKSCFIPRLNGTPPQIFDHWTFFTK